jgi:hypothetical protein
VSVGAVFVPVRSAEDGFTHMITFRLYEEGLTAAAGRYGAICGKSVLAGSLSEAPGRYCPLCRAAMVATS